MPGIVTAAYCLCQRRKWKITFLWSYKINLNQTHLWVPVQDIKTVKRRQYTVYCSGVMLFLILRFILPWKAFQTFQTVDVHYNICVFSKGVSYRARPGYFTLVHKYLLLKEDQFSLTFLCIDFGKQCSHCLLDKQLRERFMYRWIKTETYPYFSASSRASSSLTAL